MRNPLSLFSHHRKLLIISAVLVCLAALALLVYAQDLAPSQLGNTGNIKPQVGSVSSPLEEVTDLSLMKAIADGGNLDDLQLITTIPWGNMWNGSDSFFALNGTAICLVNTGDVNLYPSWTCDKLPTGCTLTAMVSVNTNYPQQGSANMSPSWSGGYKWAPNDANAFYLPPANGIKNLQISEALRIVFVLTLSTTAIPQALAFTITITSAE